MKKGSNEFIRDDGLTFREAYLLPIPLVAVDSIIKLDSDDSWDSQDDGSKKGFTLDELFVLWCEDNSHNESFKRHLVADMYNSDSDSDAELDNVIIYGGMGVREVKDDDERLLNEHQIHEEIRQVYTSLQHQHQQRLPTILYRNHFLSILYWSAHIDYLNNRVLTNFI